MSTNGNGASPYPGTQAVRRAVALLKAFDDDRPSWGLSDLAREAGLNKTTAYRLLSALESEGMVARGRDRESYTLGPEVVAMGGRALRANDLRMVARTEVERLARETGETASLEVRTGREVLVVEEIMGDYLMGGVQSIGSRWPLHATSTGLAILASLPGKELDELLIPPLMAVTNHTMTDPTPLRHELAQICQRGYAIADETLEVGLVAIGAPVYNYDGDVPAALSVAGPRLRLTPSRIAEIGMLVMEAAARVSVRLGYRPPQPKESVVREEVSVFRVDRNTFAVSHSFDDENDKTYWLSRTPHERLQHIEYLRHINYGDHATGRLQRVLEIVE